MSDVVRLCGQAGQADDAKTASAELGNHIRTDPTAIARHCFKEIAAASEDVATVVESIAFADRLFTRRRSEVWSRRIAVTIPVFEVATFQAPDVQEALNEAVGFLTGDEWSFDFVKRNGPASKQQYLPLVDERPKHVVPFSNGLDSFAQAKLIEADNGPGSLLKVRAGKLRPGESRIGIPHLEIPRGFRAGHPRERSYRTRPLVYFAFAAIAAATARADSVVIGENGQGALGPSFATFANEWPFRSAHPGFVARLALFLSKVLGAEVRFEQPQLWRTKGQVLGDLKQRGLLEAWEDTCSCSLRPLQRMGRSGCGYCGGCLLRKTALNAAAIADDADCTLDLRSPELTTASNDGRRAALAKSQQEILVRGALSMATLAELPLRADAPIIFAREARDIPGAPTEITANRLSALVNQHRQEWQSLLASLPPDAWLSRQFVSA